MHDQWVLRVFADSQVLNFGTKYFWWCSKSVLRFQAKILHRSWVCIVWCELRTNGRRMKKQMKYVWHKCAHAWKNGMSFCYFIFLRVAFSHWIFYIKKCDRSSSYWSFDWIDCHTLGSIHVALYIVRRSPLAHKEQIENNMRTRTFRERTKNKNNFEEQFRTFFDIYKRIFIYDITFHNHTSPKMTAANESNCFLCSCSLVAHENEFFGQIYSGMNESHVLVSFDHSCIFAISNRSKWN